MQSTVLAALTWALAIRFQVSPTTWWKPSGRSASGPGRGPPGFALTLKYFEQEGRFPAAPRTSRRLLWAMSPRRSGLRLGSSHL